MSEYIDTSSGTSDLEDESFMNDEEMQLYYPTFDSKTEYLFVNKCLSLINGRLPDYAYYQSNEDIKNFWTELEDEYFPEIYWYLVDNDYIDDADTPSMKDEVLDFVDSYFENRQ